MEKSRMKNRIKSIRKRKSYLVLGIVACASVALIAGCATPPRPDKPVTLVDSVDVPRFMGDWYVIASIPTMFERGAHNAMDSYRLDPDGTIATTFSYNADAFDGPKKQMSSRGYVDPKQPAIWGQQYIWPIKADYRIAWLSPDYSQTVIAREKRDYVWIMARTPTIPEADYQRMLRFVGEQGYDVAKVTKVPQRG